MPAYNVHTHIFTMQNAPEKFLHLYMPGFLADAVDNITNTRFGAWAVKKLLSLGGNGSKRYATFLDIGKSNNQAEVFEKLLTLYPDKEVKFVALTMYMEACGAGNSSSGFEGQLQEIINLKKRYPDRLIIFLGVDPRWKSSGTALRDEIIRRFETEIDVGNGRKVYPFAGLKLYPSTGFFVFDERLKPTFEWAAENQVPIMSHCSYLGGIYNNDQKYLKTVLNTPDPYTNSVSGRGFIPAKNFIKYIGGQQASGENKINSSYFLEPNSYYSLLKYFSDKDADKPLKLCLAHFAGDDEILRNSGTGKAYKDLKNEPFCAVPAGAIAGAHMTNWFDQVQALLIKFKGTYTDISYTLYNPDVTDLLLSELQNPNYGDRILFGTDFFMTEKEQSETDTYNYFKQAATVASASGNDLWKKIAETNAENYLTSKYYKP